MRTFPHTSVQFRICLLYTSPWLDVNKKVSYTPRYDPALGTLQYIVKHIEFSLKSGTMTVSMCRFFPYYPYIIDKS